MTEERREEGGPGRQVNSETGFNRFTQACLRPSEPLLLLSH